MIIIMKHVEIIMTIKICSESGLVEEFSVYKWKKSSRGK